jgi:hypothetical protein
MKIENLHVDNVYNNRTTNNNLIASKATINNYQRRAGSVSATKGKISPWEM